jgi:hypothetical protein
VPGAIQIGFKNSSTHLKRFWRHEVLTLAKARKATGNMEWPVPQEQRDIVFLSYRAQEAGRAEPTAT